MEREKILEKIYKAVEPEAAKLGLEIVDIEYLQDGGYWFVRIYTEKCGGQDVDLDECEKLSRAVEELVDSIVEEKFFLEVSSPGLERPLKKGDDYLRFIGKKAHVKLKKKKEDRKNYDGIIEDYKDGIITLNVEDNKIELSLQEIKKANLVFEFEDF